MDRIAATLTPTGRPVSWGPGPVARGSGLALSAAVVALLAHAISNLRKEAALALGELRDPATLRALHDALEDRDPEVRKAVRIAIAQIEGDAR